MLDCLAPHHKLYNDIGTSAELFPHEFFVVDDNTIRFDATQLNDVNPTHSPGSTSRSNEGEGGLSKKIPDECSVA